MKIALNMNQTEGQTTAQIELQKLADYLRAARRGDWEARGRIVQMFTPLVESIADRRGLAGDQRTKAIELGRTGLERAIKSFKKGNDCAHFQLHALKFIEDAMDGKGGGFLGRIFGR